MDEKLKKELKDEMQSIVASIFSEKEEAEQRKKTELALQESAEKIQELTVCLEGRNEDVANLNIKITDHESKITSLMSELEAAKKETEEANKKLVENETALNNLKKDRAAEIRMSELAEAKVVGSDKEAQLAKVREMSDEEFAAYKEERIVLRKSVIDELAATAAAHTEPATPPASASEASTDTKIVTEEQTEEETASEEDVIEPANIDPGQAIAAAMNMEFIPTVDMKNKYAALGKAMASNMAKKQ